MQYFTIEELCRSTTAEKRGIDNTPTPEVVGNLTLLVDNVLDPLRKSWGGPITVNSGYRCPELNKAVGGVANSEHVLGRAADITVGSVSRNKRLLSLVKSLDLPFRQLILENGGAWVHVSYNKDDIKKQVLYL